MVNFFPDQSLDLLEYEFKSTKMICVQPPLPVENEAAT